MVQSPSWEANWSAASQAIPRNSRNPKVHYRTHKRPPPVPIPGQPNPFHIPTSHFLEIHPNIIRPSTPRSPQWSCFKQNHQNTIPLFIFLVWKRDAQFPKSCGMKYQRQWTMSKTLVKLTAIYHRQNPLRLNVNYVVGKLHYYHKTCEGCLLHGQ